MNGSRAEKFLIHFIPECATFFVGHVPPPVRIAVIVPGPEASASPAVRPEHTDDRADNQEKYHYPDQGEWQQEQGNTSQDSRHDNFYKLI